MILITLLGILLDDTNNPIGNITDVENVNYLNTNQKLIKQLNEIRIIKHKIFNNVKSVPEISPVHKWPKNTLLCVSDSIMNNEKRLSRKFNMKIRCFSGATVDDMFDYITPRLNKEPGHVLLHTVRNNCKHNTSDEIITKILKLKKQIEAVQPNATVIISQPIVRIDDSKATFDW